MSKIDQVLVNGTTYEIVPEIAPLFDTAKAYAVGDCVIKDAKLYRFTSAHESGEWNASQVEEITVGDEINNLRANLAYRYNAIGETNSGYYIYGNSDSSSKGRLRKSQTMYITDYIPVYEGMKILVNGSVGGNAALLFAYDSSHLPIDNIIWDGSGNHTYKNRLVTIDEGVSYVRASFFLSANNSITTDLEGINYINEHKKVPENAVKLYTDDMIVGVFRDKQDSTVLEPVDVSSSYASYRLSSNCLVGLPFGGHTKLLFRLKNSNYKVGMRVGSYVNHMEQSLPRWMYDGDVFDLSYFDGETYTQTGANYYSVTVGLPIFQENPGSSADTAGVMSVADMDKIGLSVYAINDDSPVIEDDNQNLFNARKIQSVLYGKDSYRYSNSNAAVIVHTSDPHGDEHRIRRFYDFADMIKADLAAVTGDIVSYNTYSGFGWFHKIVKEHDTLTGICTGNHDVYIPGQTDAQVYAAMFEPIVEKTGNTNGKTYYYTDITEKKLRIISVDLYQFDGQSSIGSRGKTHFLGEQLSWLVSTLASTPNGYGIVIMEHSPQRNIYGLLPNEFYTPYKDIPVFVSDGGTSSNVDGAPIYDIVDAFIGRTTISKTYTQAGTPSSVSVSADFSNVPQGIEFIAYMSGHAHIDHVCYVPNATYNQLILNIINTSPYYGGEYYSYLSDSSDVGRDTIGKSQDSFNVYVIDRLRKIVDITRIGADITMHGTKRDHMKISYGNWIPTIATLANGTLHNPSNMVAVCTTNYVPIANGQVAWCDVKRQLTDGHYYMFSYALYNSSKTEIKFVDYGGKNKPPYVEVTELDTAYIRFAVVEYGYAGATVARRITDYSEGDVIVNVSAN